MSLPESEDSHYETWKAQIGSEFTTVYDCLPVRRDLVPYRCGSQSLPTHPHALLSQSFLVPISRPSISPILISHPSFTNPPLAPKPPFMPRVQARSYCELVGRACEKS